MNHLRRNQNTSAPRGLRSVFIGLCALPLLAIPISARQQLWVVSDNGCPDVDFNTIQSAIDSAADGDTILVRPTVNSNFGPIDIFQKSLTISSGKQTSATSYAVNIFENISIRGLLPSQSVTIALPRNTTTSVFRTGRIFLEDNQGPVWIEDLGTYAPPIPPVAPFTEAIRIENCASVTLVDLVSDASDFDAECLPTDACLSMPGRDALVVTDSEVHVFNSLLQASGGGPGFDPFNLGTAGGDGGVGVRLTNSTVNLYGSTVIAGVGGEGGQNTPAPFCSDGGNGGSAVYVSDALSLVRVQDTALTPGAGGPWSATTPFPPNGCLDGMPGLDFDGPGANSVTVLPGVARGISFESDSAVREGDLTKLVIEGALGDFVFMGVAVAPDSIFEPLLNGTSALQPLKILKIGVLANSAAISVPILIPELASPDQGTPLFLQTYSFDTNLDLFAGRPASKLALDASHDHFDGCQGIFYVDDDAPNDPGPNDPNVSDPLEDGTLAHPYDSIQEAVDSATLFDSTILVEDGYYTVPPIEGIEVFNKISLRSVNGPENCTIDAQGAEQVIMFRNPDVTLANVISGFTLTGATVSGIHLVTSSLTVENCIIEGNAGDNGGGLRVISSSPVISNCVIRNNVAAQNGGGLYARLSTPTIQNCTIVNNTAAMGGGLSIGRTNSIVRNCTIANNDGGGIYYETLNAPFSLENSIVWGNTNGDQVLLSKGILSVSYCNIQNGLAGLVSNSTGVVNPGAGIIATNPDFVDAPSGDYHLAPTSPSIDAGNPNFTPTPNEVDIDGEPRLQGSAVDIGSDEQ